MKSRVLSFGCLDAPLARSQTQSFVDAIQAQQPRLTCQLTVVPSPDTPEDRAGDTFLTASRREVAHLLELVRDERARLVVVDAADLGGTPLPVELAPVCIPRRSPPYDAFLNRQGTIMDEMVPGSRIGVMSLRSRARMHALWPELGFVVLQGGVDSAMEQLLRHAEVDGLVAPAAVTEELGIQGIVAEIFTPEFILPAPGQGIRLVIGRADDREAVELLADLHCAATATEFTAEQAFHRRMVPDQDLPVGALARVEGEDLSITGTTGAGARRVAVTGKLDEAAAVGDGLAQQLLSHAETFADLLEADFPDGLPAETDEDADLLETLADDHDAEAAGGRRRTDDLDELDDLRGFEDLAGMSDADGDEGDADEDPYRDER